MENLCREPSAMPVEEGIAREPMSVGSLVAGRYELTRLLGRGSMGEVWAANHRGLGETVALKLLIQAPPAFRPESESNSTARFRFEAKLAARLSRKTRHIVQVSDYGEEGGIPYLVMELLEGETLEARLLKRPLPADVVAKVVGQIARALEEAHADGVVHRDLKPANVFLTCDEDKALLVKLLDFGIARMIRTDSAPRPVTAGGLWWGTPGYLSPEQARMEKLDGRCDLWALATVAYEALTGELPVAGAATEELIANLHARCLVPIHERMQELPPGLGPFFERAFDERIDCRFPTASDLAAAFEQAVLGWPIAEEKGATVAPVVVQRSRPRSRRWAFLAGAVRRRAGDARALMMVTGVVVGMLTFAVANAARGPAGTSPVSGSAAPSAPVVAAPRTAIPESSGPSEPVDARVPAAPSSTCAQLSPATPMSTRHNTTRDSTAMDSRDGQPHRMYAGAVPLDAPRRLIGSPPRPQPDGLSTSAVSKSAKGSVDRSSVF